MRRILFKDLKVPLIFSLILLPPLLWFWSRKNTTELFPVAVFVQLSFTFIVTVLGVMLNEQYEDVHNGYRFYQILPLKRLEVTGLKFLVPVLVLAVLGLVNRVLYTGFPVGREALRIADTITAVFSVVVLLICAGIFLLVTALGYTRFIQLTSGLIALGVFAGFLAARLLKTDMVSLARFSEKLEKWLVSGDPVPFLVACLALYTALFFMAARMETR